MGWPETGLGEGGGGADRGWSPVTGPGSGERRAGTGAGLQGVVRMRKEARGRGGWSRELERCTEAPALMGAPQPLRSKVEEERAI